MVRQVASAAANVVRTASGVTAAGVRVGGTVAAKAITGAAQAATAVTGKGDVDPNQEPSAVLRYGVKALRGASTVGLQAARASVTVSETTLGTVAYAAGTVVPLPSAIKDNDIVLGVLEVAEAAVSGATTIVDATATASVAVTAATADAAGTMVGHKYGAKTGDLVKDTLNIAVDVGEVVTQVGRTKINKLGPHAVRHFVAGAVQSNGPVVDRNNIHVPTDEEFVDMMSNAASAAGSAASSVVNTTVGGVNATTQAVSSAASTVGSAATGVATGVVATTQGVVTTAATGVAATAQVASATVSTVASGTAGALGAVAGGVVTAGSVIGSVGSSAGTLAGSLANKMGIWSSTPAAAAAPTAAPAPTVPAPTDPASVEPQPVPPPPPQPPTSGSTTPQA